MTRIEACGRLLADRLDQRAEVRRLVVGRQRDQEPGRRVGGCVFRFGEHGGGFPDYGLVRDVGRSRDAGRFNPIRRIPQSQHTPESGPANVRRTGPIRSRRVGKKQVPPRSPRPPSSGKGGTWEHRIDVEATPALCGRRRPRLVGRPARSRIVGAGRDPGRSLGLAGLGHPREELAERGERLLALGPDRRPVGPGRRGSSSASASASSSSSASVAGRRLGRPGRAGPGSRTTRARPGGRRSGRWTASSPARPARPTGRRIAGRRSSPGIGPVVLGRPADLDQVLLDPDRRPGRAGQRERASTGSPDPGGGRGRLGRRPVASGGPGPSAGRPGPGRPVRRSRPGLPRGVAVEGLDLLDRTSRGRAGAGPGVRRASSASIGPRWTRAASRASIAANGPGREPAGQRGLADQDQRGEPAGPVEPVGQDPDLFPDRRRRGCGPPRRPGPGGRRRRGGRPGSRPGRPARPPGAGLGQARARGRSGGRSRPGRRRGSGRRRPSGGTGGDSASSRRQSQVLPTPASPVSRIGPARRPGRAARQSVQGRPPARQDERLARVEPRASGVRFRAGRRSIHRAPFPDPGPAPPGRTIRPGPPRPVDRPADPGRSGRGVGLRGTIGANPPRLEPGRPRSSMGRPRGGRGRPVRLE